MPTKSTISPTSRRCVFFCLVPACMLLLQATVHTQGTPTFSVSVTEPYEVIEEVGTTRRIGRAEIEAMHARTLDEALRLVPGIYVRTGGDGTPRIDIRGFRSRHVLLLIDGVPFNSTADGQFDPVRISTESIREIKVSYGSSSVLYGDNAMAAVIEIVTVTGGRPSAGVDLTMGTPDQRGAGGRIARRYGRLDVMVAGTTLSTSGFRLPGGFTPTAVENGGRRENSDRTRRDLRGNLAYAFSPSLTLGTEWTVGSGAYGIPPSTIDDPNDSFAQAPRYERVDGYRTASGQASLAWAPSLSLNVRGWAYRNAQREDAARYDDDTYASIDDPLVPGTFRSRDRTTVSGSMVLARIDLRRAGWLRVAVNQRREGFDSTGVIRDVPLGGSGSGAGSGGGGGRGGRQTPAPVRYDLRAFALDRHVDVYSAGTEWQFHPVAKLGAVLGAAINWLGRADTTADPSWIAGVSYDATRDVRLHASATQKIRFPSIAQLYSPATGNPALQPERAYGVDAGIDRQLGRSSVGVSVYMTHAANFIERNPGTPFVNRDRYRFSGAEAVLQTRAIPTVDLRAAYTFLDAVDVTPGAGGAELQTRPRHRVTLEAAWQVASRLSARGAVHAVADQRYYSRGTPPVPARAGDYTLVDASLTHTLSRRYDLVVGVSNLFDRLYEQAYALPREGRTAVVTLRGRFE